ncbi:MAG: butyrate kinase [Eubacteriales bacterium]|nr:butyrate kinase [Eubacteriales bacterium]
MKEYRLLVINPGSTSTKIGIFNNNQLVRQEVVRHPAEELEKYKTVADQEEMRLRLILQVLEESGIDIKTLDAVVARGGIIKPLVGGVYTISEAMLNDLTQNKTTNHACDLGGIIAADMGKQLGIPTFVVDPPVVDEMQPCAKYSGLPTIIRRSLFHALNQKAVAIRCAKSLRKPYDQCRFIVAHMGGGITVGAHALGRVIDINDGMAGDGAMSPIRTGGLPLEPVIHMCFSGKYTEDQMLNTITGGGGMGAYIGTTDFQECNERAEAGDEQAAAFREAMAYQICKEIGAMAAVLSGKMDAIILTGGMAHSAWLTDYIKAHVECFAKVVVYPGEDELLALAEGGLRVLRGEEDAKEYHG